MSEKPNYRRILEQIARDKGSLLTVFADFCAISACALAAGTREVEFNKIISNYSDAERSELERAFAELIFEMQDNPFGDLLGPYYTEINSKIAADARGEFYTPDPIAQLLAMMIVDADKEIERGLPIKVHDPAVGSGAMVLRMAEQFAPKPPKREKSYVDLLRVTAIDINPIACDMAYINMTSWGIPAQIMQGNTLTMEFTRGWKNIHWARVGEDQRIQQEKLMSHIVSVVNDLEQPGTVKKVEKETIDNQVKPDEQSHTEKLKTREGQGGQIEFF